MNPKIYAKMLLLAIMIAYLLGLIGCAPVYIRGENEIKKVDGVGWVLSDAALIDLLECCDRKLE